MYCRKIAMGSQLNSSHAVARGIGDTIRMNSMMASMRKRALGFGRDEEGAILYLALVILMLMLFVGGMAVDVMRFESERSRVQAIADASSLAAASMRQTKDPETVVRDWFQAAGISDRLEDVVVDDSLNYRNVRAVARTTTRNYFMHMLGVRELSSTVTGEAEERRTNVEVAMVLDVSGSMAGQKLRSLKAAATEFVTTLLNDDTENRVSFALVPYNGQVALGPNLITRYNITQRHSLNYCVDLPPSVYNSAGLSPNLPMPQHLFADTYSDSSTSTLEPRNNRWCQSTSNNYVRPPNNNQTQLVQQINALEAVGATSIDAGLRWGSALLDPQAQPVMASLANANLMPRHFADRPLAYEDREVLKVIILMTDGENWPNEYVAEGYRTGNSPIYRHTDGVYSIYHANAPDRNNRYYVPSTGKWQATRWAGRNVTARGEGTPLTWPEVWSSMRVAYVAKEFYSDASIRGDWVNTFRQRDGTVIGTGPHEVSTMVRRLNNLCTLVKARNVIIFGIALETNARGSQVIRDCATPGRFRDAAAANMTEVFRDIRAQISSLRLTK